MKETAKITLFVLAGIVLVSLSSMLYFQESETFPTTGNVAAPVVEQTTNQDQGLPAITGEVVRKTTPKTCTKDAECPTGQVCKEDASAVVAGSSQAVRDVTGRTIRRVASFTSGTCVPDAFTYDEFEKSGIRSVASESLISQTRRPGIRHNIGEIPGLMSIIKDIYQRLISLGASIAEVSENVRTTGAGIADTKSLVNDAFTCSIVGFEKLYDSGGGARSPVPGSCVGICNSDPKSKITQGKNVPCDFSTVIYVDRQRFESTQIDIDPGSGVDNKPHKGQDIYICCNRQKLNDLTVPKLDIQRSNYWLWGAASDIFEFRACSNLPITFCTFWSDKPNAAYTQPNQFSVATSHASVEFKPNGGDSLEIHGNKPCPYWYKFKELTKSNREIANKFVDKTTPLDAVAGTEFTLHARCETASAAGNNAKDTYARSVVKF